MNLERVVEHQPRRNFRLPRRPAGRRVVHDVEVPQRRDGRERRRDEQLVADAGKRDGEELAYESGAVHACGFVQLLRDPLRPREEQDQDEPEGDPRADQPDRRQRPGEVAEPDLRERPRPDRAQERVERTGGVVDPGERLRDDDRRDRLRHEEHGSEKPEPAHVGVHHQRGQEEADRKREDRVEEDQLDRVPEGRADLGRVEELAVVAEPMPGLRRDSVPVVERETDRLCNGEECEDDVRDEAR